MSKKKKEERKDNIYILKQISKDLPISMISDMEEVMFFPTLLTSYNRAVGIGGHPKGRVTVIHGPEQVGKSVMALILAESARRCGDISIIFDAEFASEKEWYNVIAPNVLISYPENLDDLFKQIQKLIYNLEKAKGEKFGCVQKDSGLFIVVDTLVKLMPKNILEQIEKQGVDKMYPIQALYVSTWMKSIIPQLNKTNSSLVLVMQERKNMNAKLPTHKQWSLPMGKAISYDNSIRIRVTHSTKIKEGMRQVGVMSHYKVENNKIDGTSFEEGVFYTSNGKGESRKGIDYINEVIYEGRMRGVIVKMGGKIVVTVSDKYTTIEGGWKKLKEYYRDNEREFKQFVNYLNRMVVRNNMRSQ